MPFDVPRPPNTINRPEAPNAGLHGSAHAFRQNVALVGLQTGMNSTYSDDAARPGNLVKPYLLSVGQRPALVKPVESGPLLIPWIPGSVLLFPYRF